MPKVHSLEVVGGLRNNSLRGVVGQDHLAFTSGMLDWGQEVGE